MLLYQALPVQETDRQNGLRNKLYFNKNKMETFFKTYYRYVVKHGTLCSQHLLILGYLN